MVTVPMRVTLYQKRFLGELIQSTPDNSANITIHGHLGLQEMSKLSTSARQASSFQYMLLVNNASTIQGTS